MAEVADQEVYFAYHSKWANIRVICNADSHPPVCDLRHTRRLPRRHLRLRGHLSHRTPTPTPVTLPVSIRRVVLGTEFSANPDGEIVDPMRQPISYPSGTRQIVFLVEFDVSQFSSFSARISPGFGVPVTSQNCNKYVVSGGRVRQSYLGSNHISV